MHSSMLQTKNAPRRSRGDEPGRFWFGKARRPVYTNIYPPVTLAKPKREGCSSSIIGGAGGWPNFGKAAGAGLAKILPKCRRPTGRGILARLRGQPPGRQPGGHRKRYRGSVRGGCPWAARGQQCHVPRRVCVARLPGRSLLRRASFLRHARHVCDMPWTSTCRKRVHAHFSKMENSRKQLFL